MANAALAYQAGPRSHGLQIRSLTRAPQAPSVLADRAVLPRSHGQDFSQLRVHGVLQRAPAEPAPAKPAKKRKHGKPAAPKNPCTRDILAEGTCDYLVQHSKYLCCDPESGIERTGKTTSIEEPGKECPSQKWTPIFTCDNKCTTALDKGCDDNDNWMALPSSQFTRKSCGDVYTICANGKQTTGYVRDRSVTKNSFEVSPGIQTALGVPVGSTFKGAVYRPGASADAIAKDPCCSPPAGPQEVPETTEEVIGPEGE